MRLHTQQQLGWRFALGCGENVPCSLGPNSSVLPVLRPETVHTHTHTRVYTYTHACPCTHVCTRARVRTHTMYTHDNTAFSTTYVYL